MQKTRSVTEKQLIALIDDLWTIALHRAYVRVGDIGPNSRKATEEALARLEKLLHELVCPFEIDAPPSQPEPQEGGSKKKK